VGVTVIRAGVIRVLSSWPQGAQMRIGKPRSLQFHAHSKRLAVDERVGVLAAS